MIDGLLPKEDKKWQRSGDAFRRVSARFGQEAIG
jgi:hypothetical protein